MPTDRTEIARLADACAKCGACTTVCPVYQATGRESLTARGRLHLLSRLSPARTRNFGMIFSACLLCGACAAVCPRKIDTLSLIIRARQAIPLLVQPHSTEKLMARAMLTSPPLLTAISRIGAGLRALLPENSGLRRKLSLLDEAGYHGESAPTGDTDSAASIHPPTISAFSGCLARHLSPEITAATAHLTRVLAGGTLEQAKKQVCCGLAAYSAGDIGQARELAKKNIAAFADHSLPILTSCASCYSHLRSYPTLLANDTAWAARARDFAARLREFSSFFLPHTTTLPPPAPEDADAAPPIFYHDPCHLRFGPERIIAPPRQLIQRITGAEPTNASHCCGQGGLFHLAHPDLSRTIFAAALENHRRAPASRIVTTCSGCLLQWRAGIKRAGVTADVLHLAVLLAREMQRKTGGTAVFTKPTK